MGHDDESGGAPVRRRGDRVKCLCDAKPVYLEACSGIEGSEGCVEIPDMYDPDNLPQRELLFSVRSYPNLPPGSQTQYLLATKTDDNDPLGQVRIAWPCL